MDTRVANFNNLAVKYLVCLWHAGNSSEANLKNDIATRVLNETIADLPVALLFCLIQKQNDVAVLRVACAHKGLLNPKQQNR